MGNFKSIEDRETLHNKLHNLKNKFKDLHRELEFLRIQQADIEKLIDNKELIINDSQKVINEYQKKLNNIRLPEDVEDKLVSWWLQNYDDHHNFNSPVYVTAYLIIPCRDDIKRCHAIESNLFVIPHDIKSLIEKYDVVLEYEEHRLF